MKLLLVDAHPLFLEGLANLLRVHGFEVAGTACNGLEALSKAEILHPEVILMDLQMPGGGIAATRLIKEGFPEIAVVMLTGSEDDPYLMEAIQAGASGYLLKNGEPERLVAEVSKLTQGEAPLAPGITFRLLREFAGLKPDGGPNPVAAGLIPALTARQAAILGRLAAGMTYQEIGAEFGIREVTVRYHLNEVMNKLHLTDRAELTAYLAGLGLIPPK